MRFIKKLKNTKLDFNGSERGSAIVIALMVLALLMVFVALALARTTSETVATANESSETKAFNVAEASLENMTQQFDAIFDFQLTPTSSDITNIENSKPQGFETQYDFVNHVDQVGNSEQVIVMENEALEGLYATRETWKMDTTATDKFSGVEVQLKRNFFNDRIPIFQFGIFYDDDLEFHPGPRFDFGGRVHSNGNLFLAATTGLYFSSKVTARGQILTDIARNGSPYSNWGDNVYISDGTAFKKLSNNMGSALKGTPNIMQDRDNEPPLPSAYRNPNWNNTVALFNDNLLSEQKKLNLPVKLAGNEAVDYIELIRRGRNVGDLYNDGTGTAASPNVVAVPADKIDSPVMTKSRYANQSGIRVSLADSKDRLPGCAAAGNTAACGVMLNGDAFGGINRNSANAVYDPATVNASGVAGIGYLPRPLRNGTQATRINGNRFNAPVWIKVELVSIDSNTNLPNAIDVTEDILSLGVTERAPVVTSGGSPKFAINDVNYYNNQIDSRSIIRLQRFVMPGAVVAAPTAAPAPPDELTDSSWNGVAYNYVLTNRAPNATPSAALNASPAVNVNLWSDETPHKKQAFIDDGTTRNKWIVPFPIEMFDTREGLYNDSINATNLYGANYVPRNGVMSVVEIDVGDLRNFLAGSYDNLLPTNTVYAAARGSLRASNVPSANGWVMYVSDRRGDRDFDGEYDMENIFIDAANLDNMQPGEDVNKNKKLEMDYNNAANLFGEAVTYLPTDKEPADKAAVYDHTYYRRAVRLVNGAVLPGKYDSTNSRNTQGFTFASENGVYVQGNYNATGIDSVGTPTSSTQYQPQNTVDHIPASVVGDAVTILSNSWTDSRSFNSPFALNQRKASETFIRFAMISGDAISSLTETPNQGGGNPRMGGGVHNFKRFLEDWTGVRLNYAGSLINMYNAHNNNGSFKCCNNVYQPPTRNWTFDVSFRDATRLPPATPFFQLIHLTGFQRVNY